MKLKKWEVWQIQTCHEASVQRTVMKLRNISPLTLIFRSKHSQKFTDLCFTFISAVNDGSVGMVENEEMFVLEQDQGDGWTRVRKGDESQSEGFVPTSYIQCHFYDQDAV